MFAFENVKYKEILDIPSLEIDSGVTTAIVGASGAGKTTLLRLMNKMISPTAGLILYRGEDLSKIPSVDHRREVLMLSQRSLVLDESVKGNLNMGFYLREAQAPSDDALKAVLERVKLNKALDERASKFSGGEKQRLALARVLLLSPEVYLLDEPSSALDSETELEIVEMLVEHAKNHKKTIVMVTHAVSIAERYADVIVEIAKGHIEKRQVKA
jgi:putative ABC transport system ATP-binding protein